MSHREDFYVEVPANFKCPECGALLHLRHSKPQPTKAQPNPRAARDPFVAICTKCKFYARLKPHMKRKVTRERDSPS